MEGRDLDNLEENQCNVEVELSVEWRVYFSYKMLTKCFVEVEEVEEIFEENQFSSVISKLTCSSMPVLKNFTVGCRSRSICEI